jgi:hypothetical protein
MPNDSEIDLTRSRDSHGRLTDPRLVIAPPATYLSLAIRTELGSERFRRMAGLLQGAAAREARLNRAEDEGITFRPGRIECLASVRGDGQCQVTKLLVRVPDALGRGAGRAPAWTPPASNVALERMDGGVCIQAAAVATAEHWRHTLRRMADAARLEGLTVEGLLHVVFLGDPRRCTPQAPATVIVRQSVDDAVLPTHERVARRVEALQSHFEPVE